MTERISAGLKLADSQKEGLSEAFKRSIQLINRQQNDLEAHFDSIRKFIEERCEELDSKEKQLGSAELLLEQRSKELESREKGFDVTRLEYEKKSTELLDLQERVNGWLLEVESRQKELESLQQTVERRLAELQSKEKLFELQSREKRCEELAKQLELREAGSGKVHTKVKVEQEEVWASNDGSNSVAASLQFSVTMDGRCLQIFLNEHVDDHDSMRDEVFLALRMSADPGKLVLDALEGFYPPHLKKGDKEFQTRVVQRSCTLLLAQLMRISPKIRRCVKEEAAKVAVDWKARLTAKFAVDRKIELEVQDENSLEVLGFLQLVGIYGLVSGFDSDEVLKLLETIAWHQEAPELFGVLGFVDMVPGVVQVLIGRRQNPAAIRLIHAFKLVREFPPGPILEDYFKYWKKISDEIFKSKNFTGEQIRIAKNSIDALRAVIKCIEDHKLGTKIVPMEVEKHILLLTEKAESKCAAPSETNPQPLQQSGKKCSAPIVSAHKDQDQRQLSGKKCSALVVSAHKDQDQRQQSGKNCSAPIVSAHKDQDQGQQSGKKYSASNVSAHKDQDQPQSRSRKKRKKKRRGASTVSAPVIQHQLQSGQQQKSGKRSKGSLKEYKNDEYLEYRLYWCSFGPENYGEGGGILPSRRYRLNTRNRAARPQSMRGCTCHFVVKRLYARPSLALIIYNDRRHVNKAGFVCHGPLDRDAIGPGAKKIPYICNEIQQQTMSMIYLGIPEENVLEKHIEGIQRYCGSDAKVNSLASQYVHKLGMIIKRSSHELDLDDQASIRLWLDRNKKSVFFYQDGSEADPFILGIQTEWQLQQMVRFGHHSLMAADSTFGIKRLKYPLCTLLVFDSRQHALPVAWVITRSIAKHDVSKWMKALLDRVHALDPGWKINGFLIDDAAAEIDPIRETFSCPILFSLWRVRRSWLRNIVKRCSSIKVQREIFKRLGQIVYGIWHGVDSLVALDELTQDFIDQTNFVQYFKASWVPKIEMWLSTMRTLPLASQEAAGAIEAYHVKLKDKLYDDSPLGALQRVDWLVHKLTTELHSSYWLDRYADESDSFQNLKEEYIASTSWHRASQIPDSAVILDDKDHLFAKVVSQKDSSIAHLVWNPGSEFACCDCSWSMQGNLCKHVIKANMICEDRQGYQASMSYQSFKEILMNLWKRPTDDSVALDLSMAWTHQMLDQIQKLVELNSSSDIGFVVNNLPLKWVAKKSRTSIGKPPSSLVVSSTSRSIPVPRKKNRKRKRLSRLR